MENEIGTEECRFLALPRELRDIIYHLATVADPPVVRNNDGDITIIKRNGLAGVSRQVAAEYAKSLSEDRNHLPLHHIRIHQRIDDRRRVYIPHHVQDLYLVYDLECYRMLHFSLEADMKIIRKAVNRLPNLDRVVIKFNPIDCICICTSTAPHLHGPARIQNDLRQAIVRSLARFGFPVGFATGWDDNSICGFCVLVREIIRRGGASYGPVRWTLGGFMLAREEAIVTAGNWGVYHDKIMTKRSVKRAQRDEDARTKRPTYHTDYNNSTGFDQLDPTEEGHANWASLSSKLKLPRQMPEPTPWTNGFLKSVCFVTDMAIWFYQDGIPLYFLGLAIAAAGMILLALLGVLTLLSWSTVLALTIDIAVLCPILMCLASNRTLRECATSLAEQFADCLPGLGKLAQRGILYIIEHPSSLIVLAFPIVYWSVADLWEQGSMV